MNNEAPYNAGMTNQHDVDPDMVPMRQVFRAIYKREDKEDTR